MNLLRRIASVFSCGVSPRPASPFAPPQAVAEEMAYWEDLLSSGKRLEYVSERLPEYLEWLGGASEGLRILDVGCGPFPFLEPMSNANLVVGADPLAREYEDLRTRHGARCAVPILPLGGEEIGEVFAAEIFDIVECNNALDHTRDPARAFAAMLSLTRPGGAVHVAFMEAERTHQGGSGFHSWDLSWHDVEKRIEVAGERGPEPPLVCEGPGHSLIQCDVGRDGEREWFNVYIRKTNRE